MGESRTLPEEELNRYWNTLVAGAHGSTGAPGSLDPGTAETLRWLAQLGTTPAPAASRERVRRGLREQLRLHAANDAEERDATLAAPMRPLPAHHQAPAVDPGADGLRGAHQARSSPSPRNGRVRHEEMRGIGWTSAALPPLRIASRHPLAAPAGVATRVAAAIILVVAIASAVAVLLYPLRLGEGGERASVAGSDTAALETALTRETTLVDLTLTDIPTFRAQFGMFIVTLPLGTQTEQHSGAGPQLFYVADGPVTVRVSTAPEPLEVIPPARSGMHPPRVLIAEGEQATMETGTTLLVPKGAVIDLFTTGPTSARVVDLLSATDSRGLGDGVTLQFASNGGMIGDLGGPVSITLRQGILEPDVTIPAPVSDAARQVVAPLDAADMGDLRSGMGGAVRNAGAQPVELYVLTVTSGDA